MEKNHQSVDIKSLSTEQRAADVYKRQILCISYNDLTYDDRPVMVNGKEDYSRSRTLKGVHPSTPVSYTHLSFGVSIFSGTTDILKRPLHFILKGCTRHFSQ